MDRGFCEGCARRRMEAGDASDASDPSGDETWRDLAREAARVVKPYAIAAALFALAVAAAGPCIDREELAVKRAESAVKARWIYQGPHLEPTREP